MMFLIDRLQMILSDDISCRPAGAASFGGYFIQGCAVAFPPLRSSFANALFIPETKVCGITTKGTKKHELFLELALC